MIRTSGLRGVPTCVASYLRRGPDANADARAALPGAIELALDELSISTLLHGATPCADDETPSRTVSEVVERVVRDVEAVDAAAHRSGPGL